MKTKLVLQVCYLFMFIANNSFSQSINPQVRNEDVAVTAVNGLRRSRGSLTNTTPAIFSVDSKVTGKFNKNFPGATGQTWEADGKNFRTTFYKDEMFTCALFSKRGYLFYSVTFVPKQKLPGDLKEMINNKYPKYNVSFAAEVQAGNRDIWVLHVGDEKQILTLRVEDGTMEIVNAKSIKAPNGKKN